VPEEIEEVLTVINQIQGQENITASDIEIGSTIYANKPGDGSAREQAASCQRVLGGLANITKRVCDEALPFQLYELGYDSVPSEGRSQCSGSE